MPRKHLDRFSDSKGRLFVYEKGKEVRTSTARKETTERDYFECKLPGLETNYSVEDALARLEELALPAYDKLLLEDQLNDQECTAWALYVASIFLRSRRVRLELGEENHKRVSAESVTPQALRDGQWEWYRRTGRFISQEDILAATEKAMATLADPAFRQNNSLMFSMPNLAGALGGKCWQVLRPAAGYEFPTCDAPAFAFSFVGLGSSLGSGWGLPNSYVAMPLDPGHLFIASPRESMWLEQLDEGNTVGFIESITHFAHRFTYAGNMSPKLQAMVNENAGKLVFGRGLYRAPAVERVS